MRSLLLCCFAFMLTGASVLSETLYSTRKSGAIREGAGSYYQLVASVPENTPLLVLSRAGSWVKVQLPGKQVGWIAANSVARERNASVAVRQGDRMWNSPRALAAAIKGFGSAHVDGDPGVVDSILRYSQKTFSREELAEFTRELRTSPSANRDRVRLEDLDLALPAYDAGLPEQQIGVTVAARISGKRLIEHPQLLKYLNMVCSALAERSTVYDAEVTILLLRDHRINAFALPGGYIAVTLGLLAHCRDESELAGVLAHELAHLARRHGLQELSERKVQIRADDAFRELEEEVGEGGEEEKELESLLNQTYEGIVHPRLISYELEADRIGAVLAANAGYDPFGLVRFSERVARAARETPSVYDTGYMLPDDAGERSRQIRDFAERAFLNESPGGIQRERFMHAMKSVR